MHFDNLFVDFHEVKKRISGDTRATTVATSVEARPTGATATIRAIRAEQEDNNNIITLVSATIEARLARTILTRIGATPTKIRTTKTLLLLSRIIPTSQVAIQIQPPMTKITTPMTRTMRIPITQTWETPIQMITTLAISMIAIALSKKVDILRLGFSSKLN